MTQKTFDNHKERHPEIVGYVEEAKQTIADPDVVLETDNGAVQLFRRGLGRKPFERTYLEVVVYYRGKPANGVVATYHFTDRLGSGRLLELRHQWIVGQRICLGKPEQPGEGQ